MRFGIHASSWVPFGDAGVRASISMPYRPNSSPLDKPVPANAQGSVAAPVTVYPCWVTPLFERRYCTPTSADSGRPRFRQSLPRTISRPCRVT